MHIKNVLYIKQRDAEYEKNATTEPLILKKRKSAKCIYLLLDIKNCPSDQVF